MSPANVRAARLLAMAADVAQIVVFPLFAGGALSPWDDGLDLVVAAVLTRLLGWHWAFLPTFFAELLPGFDLVPTWTAASGSPAAAIPSLTHAAIARLLRIDSEPPRRIAALPDLRQSPAASAVTLGRDS